MTDFPQPWAFGSEYVAKNDKELLQRRGIKSPDTDKMPGVTTFCPTTTKYFRTKKEFDKYINKLEYAKIKYKINYPKKK